MDIKIRTKTGVSLVDCTRKNLSLYGQKATGELNSIVAIGDRMEVVQLGEYETEKRAMEVLNLLEAVIDRGLKTKETGIVIKMPQ